MLINKAPGGYLSIVSASKSVQQEQLARSDDSIALLDLQQDFRMLTG